MANRLWMHHFGRGIVGTASNFGQLGERPTHPLLLDYLASRLISGGWSLKSLHREIMLSATYGLSSVHIRPQLRPGPRKPPLLARQSAAAGCRGAARQPAVRLGKTGCGPGRSPAVVDGEPGLAQGTRRGARQVQPAGRVDPDRFQSAHPLRLRQPAAPRQDHDPVRLPQSDRHQRDPLRDLHAPAAIVLSEQHLSDPAVGGAGHPAG